MAVFVLSYDLHKTKDYKTLIDGLESLSNGEAWRALASVWFVAGPYTADTLKDWAAKKIDDDDSLIVALLTERPRTIRANHGTSAWLDKYFPPVK